MLESEVKVYPIYLTNLANVLAIVIGGGPVGERKISGLLAADARVRLISPQVSPQLHTWAESGKIEWLARTYRTGDLAGAFLVFAATNIRTVNAQVAQEAATLGVLCNVTDAPPEGNFHVPAVHRQEGLVIAVGTSGESPARSKAVRDQLAAWLTAKHSS